MNTSAGYYQAPRPPRVPLDEVLIRLHPEGFHESFEADGINVGEGGLSMRAPVLPQVGSTVCCELESPRGGEPIEMVGKVVWAHERGPSAGEFGIRFTHLSDRDQTRIETLIQSWGRSTAKAPTVRLQLDGIGSEIVAEVESEHVSGISVEQPLPFLSIGSAVRNETTGRRGHLEAVELKMDDKTPKLVLSIGYDVASTSDCSDDAADRDTLPDDAPPAIRTHGDPESTRDEDRPRIVRYEAQTEEEPGPSVAERLRAQLGSTRRQMAETVGRGRFVLTDELLPRIRSQVADFFALIARFIGALRARLGEKPRRKQVPRSQAARAHLKNTKRTGRRYLLVGALVGTIAGAGWLIYWWAASAADASDGASPEVAEPVEAEPAPEPRATTEVEREPSELAAEQAFPVQGAPLPPETVQGTSFGADAVPGGQKHVLRMSNEVVEMEGIVEDDGFSVTIPGSLSLSRAGPIAAAHPDVEHASILNRGDFSELTVRFVAGRRPPYRVEARGPAIEITLAR